MKVSEMKEFQELLEKAIDRMKSEEQNKLIYHGAIRTWLEKHQVLPWMYDDLEKHKNDENHDAYLECLKEMLEETEHQINDACMFMEAFMIKEE